MTRDGQHINLSATFERYRPELEAFLRDAIPASRMAAELYAILRYHMGWLDEKLEPVVARSGKMIRPNLCLLAAEACGGDYRQAIPAAGAVELLHNFSLIHDDVEDRGIARHGRPTVWAKWGEPIAINAGDALLIVSELALLRSIDRGISPAATLTMVELLNDCCLSLTEGQHLDLRHERDIALDEKAYFQTIGGKTAALLGCAVQLGAVSAGAPPDQAAAFRRFGEAIGLGFQVQDDILGIWGDPVQTGKPAAADVFGCKITLPVIDAIIRAPTGVANRISAIYRSSSPDRQDVSEVITYLDKLETRERAESRASGFLNQALEVLDQAALTGEQADALRAVARSLVGRKA